MIHADPYGAGDDDHDELPPLPIPRPGEWSPMAATPQQPPAEQRLSPPQLGGGLGGGASYTASTEHDEPVGDEPVETRPTMTDADREQVEAERFTWELAARLTSGMLANPARNASSVKDAMGLFDQFLQEMHAYTKIASEFERRTSAERRTSHQAYFRERRNAMNGTAAASDQPTPPAAPVPSPKPEPTQPRPMGDYRPIPPGARGPYAPGSMAGAPPPEQAPGDDERAA